MPGHQEKERDAVCFTAGQAGAFFGAGVIHAHLAADRPEPLVVAGISTGAVSAAAMQRAYHSFLAEKKAADSALQSKAERIEAGRWAWLRRYIWLLTDKPANVFWDSLPNPTDFFADQNAPSLRDASLNKKLQIEQMEANRQKYLITNLGIWFARLPIKLSTITTALVRYVRHSEGYTGTWVSRPVKFYWTVSVIAAQLVWHIIHHPTWVNESFFDQTKAPPRPMLGWKVYASACAIACVPLVIIALLCLQYFVAAGGLFLAIVAMFAVPTIRGKVFDFLRTRLQPPLLASIGAGRSLLHNFHMRSRLEEVFGDDVVSDETMPLLLVAAPLQSLYKNGKPVPARQLWPNPKSGIKLVDAILAAASPPGVWPPYIVQEKNVWEPLVSKNLHPKNGGLDMVDGSAVRQNPLPALLDFLNSDSRLAEALQRKDGDQWSQSPRPSIHVVYSVPLEGPNCSGSVKEEDANVVTVAMAALDLQHRRDTTMEVEQLNRVTKLEIEVLAATRGESHVTVAIADEIAPPADASLSDDFNNPLSPDRNKTLIQVADGCRCTLERLYSDELAKYAAPDGVACADLLYQIARERPWDQNPPLSCGLPEVCEKCTGKLQGTVAPAASQDAKKTSLLKVKEFSNLKVHRDNGPAQPRIIFVWSGGVFRGSFHIGMIGALLAAKIRPDLIAGASVGTLMGGALASMFSIENNDDERFKRLGTLVQTFREVDQEVALTRTLKEASRDLGIRGRQIQLSASMVRKMVLSGTRADAGYAATGAPPILIDAISGLLSIPLEMTREIASTFIAGDVADATHALITAIKRRTLTKLNVETAVLGASLLENVARKLISGERVELHHAQPFRNARIAFLATTTNLGKQCHEVLCDVTHYGKPFDFIQAALSSSAFPLVFAPRRASDVFPGWGRSDVRYSDGGLFDNLPFQPAIDALADVQLEESKDYDAKEIKAYVKDRFENPDLFVAGALDPCPEAAKDADGPFQHLNEIHSRASTLGNNSKIHSFRNWCNLGYKQFSALNAELERREDGIEFIEPKVVRGYVNGAVLPVFPTDAEHLNGTFAFCKSTGMKDERLVLSVADGCYQTFKAFAEADRDVSEGLKQSLSRLQGRVPKISKAESEEASAERCPFFRISEEKFQCPFAKADQKAVYQSCLDDETHHHARPGKTGVV